MTAILKNTIREALNKKYILFFFIISTFFLIITTIILFSVDLNKLVPVGESQQNVQMQRVFIEQNMKMIFDQLVQIIILPMIGLTLFISFFTVAGFVPGMLEKGTADLFLSKPISRFQLLTGKYIGGLLIGAMNLTYVIFTFWFIISLRFGIWEFNQLLFIPFYFFIFAIINTLLVFLGIVSQNSVFSLIMTYLIYYIVSPFFSAKAVLLDKIITSDTGKIFFYIGYYLFPQTSELKDIFNDIIFKPSVETYLPFLTSFIWAAVIFSLSVYFFRKRDY